MPRPTEVAPKMEVTRTCKWAGITRARAAHVPAAAKTQSQRRFQLMLSRLFQKLGAIRMVLQVYMLVGSVETLEEDIIVETKSSS
jgi:hypothetical protein